MIKSKILTDWSIRVGIIGIIAWIIGGFLQWSGAVFVLPFWHFWVDGAFLMLTAIWLKLGAIYHYHIEQQK